jgi:hypothetical protein
MKLHVLPLMIAVALTSACAQAATPLAAAPVVAAPAANPEATRAEIDRLVARIQELSKQLGDDTRIRIEKHRFDGMGPPPPPGDDRELIIERQGMDGTPMHEGMLRGGMMPGGDVPSAMMAMNHAGIGVVLAPNQAASGVRIAAVTPDSPAMKGGLRSGDVLLSVDGRKIAGSGEEGVDSARHLLADLKKDQVVRLGYARQGKTGEAAVKADNIRSIMMFNRGDYADLPGMPGEDGGDRPLRVVAPEIDAEIARGLPMMPCARGSHDCAMPAMFEAFRWQGLNLASVDVQLGRYFGADHGVLVLSSGDDLKGLQSGDVIEQVAGADVKTPRDVMRSLRDKSAGSQLKLDVLRDRKLLALTITVPEEKALPFLTPPPPPPPPMPAMAPEAPTPPPPPTPQAPGVGRPPMPAPPAPPAAPPPPRPPQAPLARSDSPDDGMPARTVEERHVIDDNGQEHVEVTVSTPDRDVGR